MLVLLALLITEAASYTHGSRYAIVPGHGGQVQAADQQGRQDVRPQAESTASPADTSVSTMPSQGAVYRAGPSVGTEEVETDGLSTAPCAAWRTSPDEDRRCGPAVLEPPGAR